MTDQEIVAISKIIGYGALGETEAMCASVEDFAHRLELSDNAHAAKLMRRAASQRVITTSNGISADRKSELLGEVESHLAVFTALTAERDRLHGALGNLIAAYELPLGRGLQIQALKVARAALAKGDAT